MASAFLGLALIGTGCGGGSAGGGSPPDPTLTSVTLDRGVIAGGTLVTLSGTGFLANDAGTNSVSFDGVAATGVIVVDDATITCITPVGAEGPVNVIVANLNGSVTLIDGFTYQLPGLAFEVVGTATAAWSSARFRTGAQSIEFTTPDTAGNSRALVPFVGTLQEITTFEYWVYAQESNDLVAPFVVIYLDEDGDPSTWEYALRGEPVFTAGYPMPESAWLHLDVLAMKFEAFEATGHHIDCPWDAPTLTDYMTGSATTMGCSFDPASQFATREYGTLNVIGISIRAGEGGSWVNAVGYVDDLVLNARAFSEP